MKEVQEAAAQGFREITLLGQNVNSYGKDHGKASFAELLAMVDKVEGIERIRYMTSHPKDLSDEVIEVIKNSRHICKHFHLPVQYGSNRILKAMNRVYTVEGYRELVRKIRAAVPEASLTTDLIVGFPGETEEDFQQLMEFLAEIRYDQAYTFIYSKRSGTPAAEMENQVDDRCKHERLNRLMELQNSISLKINQQLVGRTEQRPDFSISYLCQHIGQYQSDSGCKVFIGHYLYKRTHIFLIHTIIHEKLLEGQTSHTCYGIQRGQRKRRYSQVN